MTFEGSKDTFVSIQDIIQQFEYSKKQNATYYFKFVSKSENDQENSALKLRSEFTDLSNLYSAKKEKEKSRNNFKPQHQFFEFELSTLDLDDEA